MYNVVIHWGTSGNSFLKGETGMSRSNSKKQQAQKAKDRGLRFRRNTDDGNTDAKEIENSGAKHSKERLVKTKRNTGMIAFN